MQPCVFATISMLPNPSEMRDTEKHKNKIMVIFCNHKIENPSEFRLDTQCGSDGGWREPVGACWGGCEFDLTVCWGAWTGEVPLSFAPCSVNDYYEIWRRWM